MKVFLDTNVIVAAVATRGLCADVLRLVLSDHELLTSGDVLAELRRVLTKKLSVPIETADKVVTTLRTHHVEPNPSRFQRVGLADRNDERILATAISAEADVLVTGDDHLLAFADRVSGTRTLSPRQLWELAAVR